MRLRASAAAFARDERGSFTVWSVVWLMLYLAIGGLAVDITDAYRNQTMLQATADASALAGVLALPDETKAVDRALAYARVNMDQTVHGTVLDDSDILIGIWDAATESFSTGAVEPNAVYVTTRRATENANPVAWSFLRILMLFGADPQWNIVADSVAVKQRPRCLHEVGIIAAGVVDISTGNDFVNEICVHGQQGVDLQTDNTFEEGVGVSMKDLGDLVMPADGFNKNPGLEAALFEQDLLPKDVPLIPEIVEGMLAGNPDYLPPYVLNAEGTALKYPIQTVGTGDRLGNTTPGTVYHVQCSAPDQQTDLINKGHIEDVVIISDCKLHNGGDTQFINVTLASTAPPVADPKDEDENATIKLSSGAKLGAVDSCADGGGVTIYSYASAKTASGSFLNGVRVVAALDISLTASPDGIEGIAAQAGRDIKFTTDSVMGLCQDGADGETFAYVYRLVR